jgi:hypothetical protein
MSIKELDGPCVATKWDRFRWRWLHRHAVEDLLYHILSTEDCGNNGVPLNHSTLRFQDYHGCEQVVSFLNDSFEVGIGSPERWDLMIERKDFHRIIRWYLGQWALEWFGLRRWIWYKLLYRRVERPRKHSPKGE